MLRAVELGAIAGPGSVDTALAAAAAADRFADGDLASILDHLAAREPEREATMADEAFSVQPGTAAWSDFGR